MVRCGVRDTHTTCPVPTAGALMDMSYTPVELDDQADTRWVHPAGLMEWNRSCRNPAALTSLIISTAVLAKLGSALLTVAQSAMPASLSQWEG